MTKIKINILFIAFYLVFVYNERERSPKKEGVRRYHKL